MTQIPSQDNFHQGDSNNTSEKEKSGSSWSTFVAAASFALLIICLSLIFYSFNLSSEINNKEEIISHQETQIAELISALQQKEEMLAILKAREIDMVLMSGLEVNPDGYGKVIWDSENKRALLQVSNLPVVPEDKDYQLWFIKNNTPVSAGVFAVETDGNNLFNIDKIAINERSADGFAVTLEPKGGVPKPTGQMYLLGKMGN